MRVLDGATDKYGLNAYISDSTNDGTMNYDRALFATGKDGAAAAANLRQGEWADVKIRIVGGSLDGKTAGMLVKVERLSADLAQVRLFHTSVARANATWTGWSEPGFTGDFEEYVAQKFASSTAADFTILEAGIVSEDTYVEQGLLLREVQPAAHAVHRQQVSARSAAGRLPGDRRVPAPVPRPGHQDAAERRTQPRATTTSRSTARRTAVSPPATATSVALTRAPTQRLRSHAA